MSQATTETSKLSRHLAASFQKQLCLHAPNKKVCLLRNIFLLGLVCKRPSITVHSFTSLVVARVKELQILPQHQLSLGDVLTGLQVEMWN